MAVRISTGLRVSVLSDFGLALMMNYGVIEVYSGTQPDAADEAPTGTLLGTITNNGDPFTAGTQIGALEIEVTAAGQLQKVGTWRLNGVATGTAGWWRWKWNATDSDAQSQYYPRMDGLVGETLILASTSITPSTDVEIESFIVSIGE